MASYRGIDHHEGIPTTGAPGPDLVHRSLAVNGFGRSLKEFEEEAAVLLAPMKDVSERVDA